MTDPTAPPYHQAQRHRAAKLGPVWQTSTKRGCWHGKVMAVLLCLAATAITASSGAGDGNRLGYLDTVDPYYVGRNFPKLTTRQWVTPAVSDDDEQRQPVDAVVVLAIDDMRGYEKWEQFLRPTIDRLRRIDSRAPVSIMTIRINPDEPHLQTWLNEGLSLEVHTFDHPCPLLQDHDLAKARSTYERCVDLMAAIPGSQPVAFRMPCCDSLNTFSPRFLTEIFGRKTEAGNFLRVDSSVFQLFTANDPALPRELVWDESGRQRFRKYLPFPSFVNTIEDYPYPYVIGGNCWEFPCMVPSDWEAQNLHSPNNPETVRDWNAALDATVLKRGVFSMVYHPHGWIRAEQINQLIDHAQEKYGGRVLFLTFREAHERLTANLLAGQALRADDGGDNGVRLLDLDDDGFLDVVIANESMQVTRIWEPAEERWHETSFPVPLVSVDENGTSRRSGAQFGVVASSATGREGIATLIVADEKMREAWQFDGQDWRRTPELLRGLSIDGKPLAIGSDGRSRGVRLADLDGDGSCELIVANDRQRATFRWSASQRSWRPLPFVVPEPAVFADKDGNERGLRLVDVDDDTRLDLLYSNETEQGLWLFDTIETGWAVTVTDTPRASGNSIPMIARGATNNGAWFHSRGLWVQNEDTAEMDDLVDRRSFNDLLGDTPPRPRDAKVAAHTMKPRDGFRVELVAAEPLVVDPVAFDFGPDGRLWVAEMGDYPDGADGQGSPGGRVRVLDDSDGDGRFDHSTLFADGLTRANSVLVWRDGVIICTPPEIIFAKDTDGDGRADHFETLYDGLDTWNPQHMASGLKRGLDNWIYMGDGNSNAVRSIKTGKVVDVHGKDFRIRPDAGEIESLIGQSQFVRSRNDWGDWFGNTNNNPMWQYVIEDRYLSRNPHVPVPDVRPDVFEVPGSARVYPASRILERFNDLHTAGRFTSACSAIIYRDTLFGPGFEKSAFVSEPVHNLVHREVVRREGIRLRSRRADDEQTSEFLASTDNWCRPTMIDTGPDGALWVADMYRRVIEHTEWIPEVYQAQVDVRAGSDMGRIYRVVPVGINPRQVPNLSAMTTDELVAVLESPNGPLRDLAQQQIVHHADKSVVGRLEEMATNNTRPLARLHALYTLDGLGALTVERIEAALNDAHPQLRRHGIRLAEQRLGGDGAASQRLLDALARMATGGDGHEPEQEPVVLLQLALTLGESNDAAAGEALSAIALRTQDDEYIQAAVMSSALPHLEQLTDAIIAGVDQLDSPDQVLTPLIASAIGAGNDAALATILGAITQPDGDGYAPWKLSAVAELIDRLDRAGKSLDDVDTEAADKLTHVLDYGRTVAADATSSLAARQRALRLLGAQPARLDDDLDLLARLLEPTSPTALQLAAVERLGQLNDPRVPDLLLSEWATYTPALRREVMNRMFQRRGWLNALLDAVADGRIDSHDIDAARRSRLLTHKDEEIRQRAEALLAANVNSDRQQVIDTYRSEMPASGDPERGRVLFEKRCAVCHHWQDMGHEVGPDLAALSDKSTEAMLIAVLDPNRAVESRYTSYSAVTDAGLTYTGLLGDETGGSITLVEQEGKRHVVQRGELETLASSGKSLMPEGFEKDLTPAELADVIAFVQSTSASPKDVPGNHPEIVRPEHLRHELPCLASNAEIFGTTLRIEEVNGALGWWNSNDDRAVWNIEVEEPGRYHVLVEYACDDASAGNQYVIEVAGQTISRTVESTGDWNVYRRPFVGSVDLPQGRVRLTVRPDGPIHEALMDLKSVTLRPEGE